MGTHAEINEGSETEKIAHDAEELENVLNDVFGSSALTTQVDDEGDGVSFVFGDETITLPRGMEHSV